jgi:hypothetical protein
MNDLWHERLAFARTVGLDHVLGLPQLNGRRHDFSCVLVGSTATGFLHEGSDVDIAVVCDEAAQGAIGSDRAWEYGDGIERMLDSISLHCYLETFENIAGRVAALDDRIIYLYSTGIPLHDPAGRYAAWAAQQFGLASGLHERRLAARLTLIEDAAAALPATRETGDPFAVTQACLELLGSCLRLTALIDAIPFDPRKRLFTTALAGPLGRRLERDFRAALAELSGIAELSAGQQPVMSSLSGLIDRLRREALARDG